VYSHRGFIGAIRFVTFILALLELATLMCTIDNHFIQSASFTVLYC
jgi:hypothetical protein